MAFRQQADVFGGFEQEEIYVANADGTGQTRITTTEYTEVAVDWQPVNNYPRPGSATPFRVPLVPAYTACGSPNSTHVAPVNTGSCSPPATASSTLTTGTAGQMSAFARFNVIAGNGFTYADEAVRLESARPTFVLGDKAAARWPDSDSSQGALTTEIRITDRGATEGWQATCGRDLRSANASAPQPERGSTCGVTTTATAAAGLKGRGRVTPSLLGQVRDRAKGTGTGRLPAHLRKATKRSSWPGWFVPLARDLYRAPDGGRSDRLKRSVGLRISTERGGANKEVDSLQNRRVVSWSSDGVGLMPCRRPAGRPVDAASPAGIIAARRALEHPTTCHELHSDL